VVETTDNSFRFEGLTFHRKDDDHVDVHLAMHGKDGAMQEVTFAYTRVAVSPEAPATR
jgi:hypothetical protein